MATEIKCEKMVMKDIFSLWFRIPEYQRPYVWDTDQVKELLEDTMDAYTSNAEAQYFLGSMVLKINSKSEGGVTYNEYELLDGQQRLTTIFLLFAVIRDMADKNDKWQKMIAEDCENAIFQEENPFQDRPERIRIVFDIRDDVRNFVVKYVKINDGTNKTDEIEPFVNDKTVNVSIRNMANAIMTIRSYISENISNLLGFFKYFQTKVLMIYVATEELQDAFQLFTVLNNRGVKLSNSDILKAINLKEVSSPLERTNWAKKWEVMESYFGEDFDKFLSHVRTILVKKKATVNLLKEFKDNVYSNKRYNRTTKQYETCVPLLNKGKETFAYIYNYYSIYTDLFDKTHFDVNKNYGIYNYLKLMEYGLGVDYWAAPVMAFYHKFRTTKLLEFIKALDRKLSSDWITSLSPTLRIENANAILQDIEKSMNADGVLESQSLTFSFDDFERILRMDVYGKRYARYLMMKLDLLYLEDTTPFNPPATISIEHILPQHPSNGSQWLSDFNDAEREEWTDKLGNLALISRRKNTAQGNLDFDKKKEKYFKRNVEVFSNSIRIYQKYSEWKPLQLKQNQDEVIGKLLVAYGK